MRLIHLTDLHITEGPRLPDHAEVLERVVTDAIAAKPDAWLITGDIGGHSVPHKLTTKEREVLCPQLTRMADVAPVIILRGNHDDALSLELLELLDGVWPIRAVTVAETFAIVTPSGPLNVYAMPYIWKHWLLAGETRPLGIEAIQRLCEDKIAMLLELWQARLARTRAAHPEQPHVFLGHLQVRGSRTSGGEVLAGQEIEITTAQLEALRVDYGALGHLHLRQEVAPRYWYAGSLWRNDHAETEEFKGWHLVDVGAWPGEHADATHYGPELCDGARLPTRVAPMASGCRRFVTLDYRWAQPGGEAEPRWTKYPNGYANHSWGIDGAEVRMRLTVPAQHVAGCPWDAEIEKVRALGAHRIQAERIIEPVLRVRAPEVAAAKTLREKLIAYWTTTATELTDAERDAALANLDELETLDDDAIRASTHAMLDVDPDAPLRPIDILRLQTQERIASDKLGAS